MQHTIHSRHDSWERRLVFKALEQAAKRIEHNVVYESTEDEDDYDLVDYLQEAAEEWLRSKRSVKSS